MACGYMIIKINIMERLVSVDGRVEHTIERVGPYYTYVYFPDDQHYNRTKEWLLDGGHLYCGGITGLTQEEINKSGSGILTLLRKLREEDNSEIDIEGELENIFRR